MEHALERVSEWRTRWRETGALVLLLDFDGTLAPIVERAERAELHPEVRTALARLQALRGVHLAIVSGRGMADARSRVGIPGIAYAGNHGMEIEGPGVRQVHAEAAAARPKLEEVAERLADALRPVVGAWVEDKGLTLSVHYRLAARGAVAGIRSAVAAEVARAPALRLTEGKEVLEVRPDVDWDKGRAVEFLLAHLDPPAGAPTLYLGDDRTDEDAFRVLAARGGGGVIVADPPPPDTAADSYLRDPAEVATLLHALADPR